MEELTKRRQDTWMPYRQESDDFFGCDDLEVDSELFLLSDGLLSDVLLSDFDSDFDSDLLLSALAAFLYDSLR